MKHRSEKNYYNVFSYSPNGAAIHEIVYDSNKKPVNYRILDVNVAFEKILSLPKKQVIGKLATEAYQTDYAPYLNEYYQAADSKEPLIMEVYFEPMHKYFKISCFFLQEHIFATVFEDISSQKLSEQMLLLQKDLGIALSSINTIEGACDEILTTLLNVDGINAGAIYLIDKESEIITLQTVGGLSPQKPQSELTIEYHSILGEVIQKVDTPIFSNIESFPYEIPQRILYEKLKAVALIPVYHKREKVGIITIGSRATHRFSEPVQHFLESIAKTFGDTLIRIVINRSEIQESGDLFKETIEQSFDGIMIMDLNYNVLKCNKMQGVMHDLKSEEIVGKTLWDFYKAVSPRTKNANRSVKDLVKKVKEYEAVLMKKGSVIIEREFRKNDNEILTYEISYFLIRVYKKTLVCSITRDITKQKKLERMKDHFIHMVSHETRTPITSILHGIDLLSQDSFGYLSNEQNNMLAICRNNANRLQSFLDDILHFQELYEERISLNVVPIQVNRLLNEVFVSLKKEADLKKLKFTIELDQDTPFIEGDAEKLQYVFYTIISNAIRYTRKGSIQVLSSYDPNKELVILQVTDTGIGIKTEDLTHLFTAFSQIPSEENYHIPESKGLSLASAKKIVELHGGSIQVKSEYKKGSEFCIQLPLKYEKYYSKIKN